MKREGDDGEGRRRKGIREGLSQGLGFLSALKDAIEETLAETREQSGPNAEAARDALKGALSRAQAAAETARDRLDFVTRRENGPAARGGRGSRCQDRTPGAERPDRVTGRAPG